MKLEITREINKNGLFVILRDNYAQFHLSSMSSFIEIGTYVDDMKEGEFMFIDKNDLNTIHRLNFKRHWLLGPVDGYTPTDEFIRMICSWDLFYNKIDK